MDSFLRVEGVAAAMPAGNVDTDVIMPKIFLKGVDRSGLREGLFHDLRFDEQGRERPDFVLNQDPWRTASFLVVGPNFGCGSSREHAVWGLMQYGVRALISTTFAGIFFDNCANNGLLAITLDPSAWNDVMASVAGPQASRIAIDLPEQQIVTPNGAVVPFQIDQSRKTALVRGLDAIQSTLEMRAEIERFQAKHFEAHPWLGGPSPA